MLTTVLLVLALVCFIAAAIGVASPRFSLGWLGLALWVLVVLLGG